jgi:hypothetical protein
MNRHFEILLVRLAIVAVASGAWCCWRFADWQSRLHLRLENLRAANEQP